MAEQSHAYPRVTYNIPYAISVFRDLKGDFALNTITPARENRSQAVLNAATVPCHLLRDRDDVNHAVSSFLESPWLAKHKLRARCLTKSPDTRGMSILSYVAESSLCPGPDRPALGPRVFTHLKRPSSGLEWVEWGTLCLAFGFLCGSLNHLVASSNCVRSPMWVVLWVLRAAWTGRWQRIGRTRRPREYIYRLSSGDMEDREQFST